VRVYDSEQKNVVGRWQPYAGAAVSRVLFLHRTAGPTTGEKVFLCTGGRSDSEVRGDVLCTITIGRGGSCWSVFWRREAGKPLM
jgi:hypothetical protein